MPERPPELANRSRRLALLAALVIEVALIGFASGTRPSEYQAQRPLPRKLADLSEEVERARTHSELARHPWRSGAVSSGWLEGTSELIPAPPSADPGGAEKPRARIGERRAALEGRAARRAFDGAPPTIPHPVQPGGAAECLACHARGLALGPSIASPIPHAAFASCTQCHVVASAPFTVLAANDAASAENRFVGRDSPLRGERAYPGAPPTTPHTTWLRERCESCHGSAGRAALRTPHPERQSCQQCHTPSAALDQRSRG